MKPPFSVNCIALGNIRNRRKQYVLLVTAIVLAIYFVSTMLLFASTMFTSLAERHYQRMGEQDAIIFDVKDAPLEELIANGTFSEYGRAEILAYVLPDGENIGGGFSLAIFDDTALTLARKDTLEGRLPEKKGEIALEQSMLARLRTDAGVGETITLTLMIPDGAGFMDSSIQKSYTLVGILTDKLIYLDRWGSVSAGYNDYPAGVLAVEEQIAAGGKTIVNVYGRNVQDARTSFEQLMAFCTDNGIMNNYDRPSIDITQYHLFRGDYNSNDNTIVATFVFFMVITVILVLAACLGIVNAFSANLETRKRQIGLLRAVGATKKQIREIFGRETLLLSVFSIPIGLMLACFTVWGITELMGPNYLFRPNALVIVGVAVAGVLCVMSAASIPLRKAANIPPMQAIRNVELSRKIRQSQIKSKQLFDVPRLIARRNLTLYRNKQVSITAMLVVSIVLMSLVAFMATPLIGEATWDYGSDYFMGISNRSVDWLMEYDFHNPGITEQDRADVEALSTVKTVTGGKVISVKILTDKITPYITAGGNWSFDYLSPEPQIANMPNDPELLQWRKRRHNSYIESKLKYGYTQDFLTVDCYGIDVDVADKLSTFVSAGRINSEKLSSGEEVLIIAPAEYGIYEEQHGEEVHFSIDFALDTDKDYRYLYQNDMFQVGDALTLSLLYSSRPEQEHRDGPQLYNEDGSRKLPEDAVRVDKTVTIGAILETHADGKYLESYIDYFFSEVGTILTTSAGLNALGFDRPYRTLAITLSESPSVEMEEYLDRNLSQIASRTSAVNLTSRIAAARENRQMVYGLLIAASAVVILFFAICVSMINNALSARIRASKREIGTIRAVGASKREIARSYLWQLTSMFVWGTAIGMAVQLALCGWLSTNQYVDSAVVSLPVWQPLLFVVVLFGICYLNVRSKVGGIFKDSIVENIREL
ncbi:MAG: FtsX-like permease family protein [Firmicutes bacterium]|nr:FtsX-like permease family protein [Bacillota bacterium]